MEGIISKLTRAFNNLIEDLLGKDTKGSSEMIMNLNYSGRELMSRLYALLENANLSSDSTICREDIFLGILPAEFKKYCKVKYESEQNQLMTNVKL